MSQFNHGMIFRFLTRTVPFKQNSPIRWPFLFFKSSAPRNCYPTWSTVLKRVLLSLLFCGSVSRPLFLDQGLSLHDRSSRESRKTDEDLQKRVLNQLCQKTSTSPDVKCIDGGEKLWIHPDTCNSLKTQNKKTKIKQQSVSHASF